MKFIILASQQKSGTQINSATLVTINTGLVFNFLTLTPQNESDWPTSSFPPGQSQL